MEKWSSRGVCITSRFFLFLFCLLRNWHRKGKGNNFSILTSIYSWGILIPYIQALISDSDFERLNNLIDQVFIQDIKNRDEKLARLAGKLIFLSLPVVEKQVKKDPELVKYELELS
jgi:hypothetical protein